jgi:gliding motility-associated-like protein
MTRHLFCLAALALFFIVPPRSQAQNTVNVWYFGDSAGIDFNSGVAVPLTNGVMNTEEGCATICNAVGNLLFFTNGVNVWNRNRVLMPNGFGLFGHISATQSGIIVPRPGVNTQYYVFTVDELGLGNGLRYSEVDMTLDGGFGDVTVKNIPLTGPVAEKVTAVNHANNVDFWVITHGWNNNSFFAYQVTAAGVNPVPVVSNVGTVHNGTSLNTLGYLKGSHDGTRLGLALYESKIFEFFDFDNTTGVVSNPITCLNANYYGAYGLEFSPDNNLVYGSVDNGPASVYQFDLTAGTPAAIAASATIIGSTTGSTKPGAIQLGPDNKIYIARNNSQYLAVLNDPDVTGLGCNFVNNGFQLGNQNSWYGLPNFIQNIFIRPFILSGDSCLGDVTTFSLTSTANVDSVKWDFGDPGSGAANQSVLLAPVHTFSDSGWFHTICIYYHSGLIDTAHDYVHIVMAPFISLGADRTLCPGGEITLDISFPGASCLWFDGADSCMRVFNQPGTYWAQVSNRCGSPRDTMTLAYFTTTLIDPGPDTTICKDDTLIYDAGPGHQSQLWNNGETTQTIFATTEGIYSVYVVDVNGCPEIGSAFLHIDPCHQYLFMANAFTPNGDGLNDAFIPIPGGSKVQVHAFHIFDRWGLLIFETAGIGWDGKFKSVECPEGVYSWRIYFTDEDGVDVQQSGSVTLIR